MRTVFPGAIVGYFVTLKNKEQKRTILLSQLGNISGKHIHFDKWIFEKIFFSFLEFKTNNGSHV